MKHLTFRLLLSVLMIIASNVSVAGVTPEETKLSEVSRGSLLLKTDVAGNYRIAPVQETSVVIKVTGPIARAVVKQRFTNPGNEWAEAIYAFPLPEQAAVDHMRLRVDERIIEGQIKEKDDARKTYEQAKQEGKRSALVEQHRPNLFTTSVANIPPQGEVAVEIEYQQQLLWEKNQFSLRFPMAITPRYKPQVTEMLQESIPLNGGWATLPGEIPNAVPIEPVTDNQADSNPVTLSLLIEPGFPLTNLQSLYHPIRTVQTENLHYLVQLEEGSVPADRDFVLQWQPESSHEPRAAFFTEQTESGTYGLLMVMPPEAKHTANIPRETIFIIDTSGSMGGASIRQAKAALIKALEGLSATERFNIVEFNSDTHVLFHKPEYATPRMRNHAVNYVNNLDAGGGTEMQPALEAAFNMPDTQDSYLRQIIFITDGAVGNEEELMNLIHNRLGSRRLFTIGIGSAPNSHFMTEAAHFGRGTFTFIGNLNEVDEKMAALFAKLEKPALTDVNISLSGQADVLPDPLPDLYEGEPVVAIMKLEGEMNKAEISGKLASTQWNSSLSLNSTEQQNGLGVYWAREKIRHWMRKKAQGHDAANVRDEVIKLAMEHHLVSQYTSLVAVDVTPVRPLEEGQQSHALKSNLPAGWEASHTQINNDAVHHVTMAAGATSSQAYMMFGLLLLIISFWFFRAKSGLTTSKVAA